MAKRLLGKEVTAALNERIKADAGSTESKRSKSNSVYYSCW